jgi:hypothetical protein
LQPFTGNDDVSIFFLDHGDVHSNQALDLVERDRERERERESTFSVAYGMKSD